MISLNNAVKNQPYVINNFSEDLKIKRRLCDLGFIPGEKITVVRKSLLKKAILLEIRGYTLSLKSSIAAKIMVEKC